MGKKMVYSLRIYNREGGVHRELYFGSQIAVQCAEDALVERYPNLKHNISIGIYLLDEKLDYEEYKDL